MFSHIMIGTNDLDRAKTFYDAVLGTLGVPPARVDGHRIFYMTPTGVFSVSQPIDGKPATSANGGTIGFACSNSEQADAWHAAGLANGGVAIEEPPGVREGGVGKLYLAYLRDPDGNKDLRPAPDGVTGGLEASVPDGDLSAVDAVYQRIAREEHVPGLVAGVVRDGRLAHLSAIGVAEVASGRLVGPTTAFRIASMTKNVVALTILQLRDEGRIALDAPASTYAPELSGLTPPSADGRPVTVRDLLCHVAGFVTDDPWGDRQLGMAPEALDRLIAGGGLFAQPPEVAFEYSNLGYALLGRVITRVTGRPYQEAVRERLLAPLGMGATTFDVFSVPEGERATGYRWAHDGWSAEAAEPDGEFGAMGGLATCARDYAAYVAFLLQAWPPRDAADGGPVRRASVRELVAFHAQPTAFEVRDDDGVAYPVASAYGAGMTSSIDGMLGRYLHHAGGLPGYASHVLLSPETGIGLFAFANRTYAPMGRANWLAAVALKRAGIWQARAIAASAPLAAAMNAIVEAFNAGRIELASEWLSDNLLADEPAADRNAEISRLVGQYGPARLQSLTPRHALGGRFVLAGRGGAVSGEIVLTPGPSPKIQKLSFCEPSSP